ncbi:hypothetical protein L9F63_026983, partial [Diploptera punctata]
YRRSAIYTSPNKEIIEQSQIAVSNLDVLKAMIGISLPLIPAFQRFLSSHCPSSIPLFIMASYIPSYHVLLLLPLFLLLGTIQSNTLHSISRDGFQLSKNVR